MFDDLWEVKHGHLQTRYPWTSLWARAPVQPVGRHVTLGHPGLCPEVQLWQGQISALGRDLEPVPQRRSASGKTSAVSSSGPGEWCWSKRWPELDEQGGQRSTGNFRAEFYRVILFASPFCCGNADVMAGATAATLGHSGGELCRGREMQAGSSGALLGPQSHHTPWEGICSSSHPMSWGSTGWEGWRDMCVCVRHN